MEGLRKPVGMYLVAVAVVVAVFFIINTFLEDSIDVMQVWLVLDVLMLTALIPALIFNYVRKREADGEDSGGAVTVRYLTANVAFFLTAALVILFLHNWFTLLAQGTDSLDGNHPAWNIWAVVDTMLPLVVGTTGCRMWCGAGKD